MKVWKNQRTNLISRSSSAKNNSLRKPCQISLLMLRKTISSTVRILVVRCRSDRPLWFHCPRQQIPLPHQIGHSNQNKKSKYKFRIRPIDQIERWKRENGMRGNLGLVKLVLADLLSKGSSRTRCCAFDGAGILPSPGIFTAHYQAYQRHEEPRSVGPTHSSAWCGA